jgi:hypothetical protein
LARMPLRMLGVACLLAAGGGGWWAAAGIADHGSPTTGQVTICHHTGDPKRPFIVISPDASGVYSGHGQLSHQFGDDIIPAFSYVDAHGDTVSFPGQNLSTLYDGVPGATLLENDCVAPAGTTTVAPTTTQATTGTTTTVKTTTTVAAGTTAAGTTTTVASAPTGPAAPATTTAAGTTAVTGTTSAAGTTSVAATTSATTTPAAPPANKGHATQGALKPPPAGSTASKTPAGQLAFTP